MITYEQAKVIATDYLRRMSKKKRTEFAFVEDVETGDYEVGDAMGIESAHHLRRKHPEGQFFGVRIGYNVAESFGGVMERTSS